MQQNIGFEAGSCNVPENDGDKTGGPISMDCPKVFAGSKSSIASAPSFTKVPPLPLSANQSLVPLLIGEKNVSAGSGVTIGVPPDRLHGP